MLLTLLGLASSAFKAIGAIFGFISKEQDVQQGVDKQTAADKTVEATASKAEATAAVNAGTADANLKKGTF